MSRRDAALRELAGSRGPVPAIVVGLDCITGLQTARILAGLGIPVIGVAARPNHFACRTNACRAVVMTGPDPADVVATLVGLATDRGVRGMLFPCTDAHVLAIARHRERLAAYHRFALPPTEVVESLMSKDGFAVCAARLDIPVPRTVVVDAADDVRSSVRGLVFPLVAKPLLKSPAWEEAVGAKVVRLATAPQWEDVATDLLAVSPALVLQEWVPGSDSELYSVNWYAPASGAPVTFVARKLRQWPPDQGTSSLGEEVRADPVLALAQRILDGVDYHGLGYLEVKRDERTGHYVAIETNVGRPTGRSAIAEAGGVGLLETMYRDLLDLPLPHFEQTYGGVKWIYLRHDLQSAFAQWRRGQTHPGDWLRSLRGRKAYAVWSARDPLPFLVDWAGAFSKAARPKRRRGNGRQRADAGRPGRHPAPREPVGP